jgi:hypothetical protein
VRGAQAPPDEWNAHRAAAKADERGGPRASHPQSRR